MRACGRQEDDSAACRSILIATVAQLCKLLSLEGETRDGSALLAAEAALVAERLDIDAASARALLNDIFGRSLIDVIARVGPAPTVKATLETLVAADIRIAVASDRPARAKLQALGLDALPWSCMVCADETGALKPSARVTTMLASRLR